MAHEQGGTPACMLFAAPATLYTVPARLHPACCSLIPRIRAQCQPWPAPPLHAILADDNCADAAAAAAVACHGMADSLHHECLALLFRHVGLRQKGVGQRQAEYMSAHGCVMMVQRATAPPARLMA